MAKDLYKKYPPYKGNEPYIWLMFDDADSGRVEPLLKLLRQRGCRVWYPASSKKGSVDLKQERLDQYRMDNASFAVLFLTENAKNNDSLAGNAGWCQENSETKSPIPLTAVEADKGITPLSMALSESTPFVRCKGGFDPEEAESGLIESKGFTMDLIGPPETGDGNSLLKKILLCILCAAVLISGYMAYRIAVRPASPETPAETPLPVDPSTVTELELDRFSDTPEELLAKFPNLKTIIIPQSAAESAGDYIGTFRVLIREG